MLLFLCRIFTKLAKENFNIIGIILNLAQAFFEIL